MKEPRFDDRADRRRRRGLKVAKIFGMVLVGLCIAALFALIFGFLVKWLWNWLMPDIFGLGAITYWQAFGLVILSKILFSGFGHHSKEHKFNHFRKKAFNGESSESEPNGCRPFDRWKNYGRFWHEEGRTVFCDWMERTKNKDASSEKASGAPDFQGKKAEESDG